jgi:uncharacterized protein (DUF1330 family)
MQKGYWVSCYREIYDADKLAAYAALAKPAIESQGGQFLVRGLRPMHLALESRSVRSSLNGQR